MTSQFHQISYLFNVSTSRYHFLPGQVALRFFNQNAFFFLAISSRLSFNHILWCDFINKYRHHIVSPAQQWKHWRYSSVSNIHCGWISSCLYCSTLNRYINYWSIVDSFKRIDLYLNEIAFIEWRLFHEWVIQIVQQSMESIQAYYGILKIRTLWY